MMIPSPGSPEGKALEDASTKAASQALEGLIARVETHLAALGDALRQRDSQGIETHAAELHQALARAMDGFTQAARQGHVPRPLRHRLAQASGQMAAQRESLARATAALDRAIDVLMPSPLPAAAYGAHGGLARQPRAEPLGA
jgi:exonuclease VII large subunit